MPVDPETLIIALREIISTEADRKAALQKVADLIRESGNYRWVGLYDVDHARATVMNIVWSGPGAPEYPTFPITKGLTATAISNRQTVNAGDVRSDPRYLTAFGSTKSEIIVPMLAAQLRVSSAPSASKAKSRMPSVKDIQTLLDSCSIVIRPFWNGSSCVIAWSAPMH
jgi:putative methionine-R-sulfoxide reductase with GAF domain